MEREAPVLASSSSGASVNFVSNNRKQRDHRTRRRQPMDVQRRCSQEGRQSRLCVNLTAVNKALILDLYPLPTMDELTAKFTGSTVFSKIDLLWGYLQLPLSSDSRYLTAFVTQEGVRQFKSLPFGLATGPSAFHKVIRKILEGLDGCVSILDDILVYGRSTGVCVECWTV